MKRFALYTLNSLILLCLVLAGCTEDIPDPLTHEAILGMLRDLPDDPSDPINGNSEPPNGTSEPSNKSSKIAFVSGFDIPQVFLINPDGTGLESLGDGQTTGIGYSPFWSPDGRIAYFSFMDFGFRVMNIDGTNSEVVASEQLFEMNVFDPHYSWSQSGKIAFSAADAAEGSSDIYSMDTDGLNPLRLTDSPAWSYSYYPSWSPDGTKVAFTFEDFDGNSNIFAVEAGGVNVVQITFTGSDYQPVWSPDGRKIAFVSDRVADYEIYVMNADGTDQTNLTNDPDGDDERPTWSPDGTKIAFQSDRNFDYEIYVMNADGTNQVNITNNSAADDLMPAWSP